nr:uncharacterized protein LOC105729625 isoform X3 [Aotus nancymaae]XP_012325983.1 uncharacterized protein LOC105729625 isoform X3 [Aotus nancymaae]
MEQPNKDFCHSPKKSSSSSTYSTSSYSSSGKRQNLTCFLTNPHCGSLINADGHGEVWTDWNSTSKFFQYGWRCTTNENTYSNCTLMGNWNQERYDLRNVVQPKPLPSQFGHYFETTYDTSYNNKMPRSTHNKAAENILTHVPLWACVNYPHAELVSPEGQRRRQITQGTSHKDVCRPGICCLSDSNAWLCGLSVRQRPLFFLLSWRGRAASVGAAPRTRASAASAAMSGRSVPHAHPATAEYEFANPSRLGEQRFGEGLLPEEILTPTLYHGYYVRPRAAPAGEGSRAGASELRLSEGKFQAFLDVSHFTPDEVTVRTVDNLLEVSARHPQRLDRHGFVSREFCRTYVLPADVDPWRVRAALSHDGILNLEAPRGGRHLDTEVNEVYISLLPAPPDPEEEEEAARVEP